jgi:hypothetical protein
LQTAIHILAPPLANPILKEFALVRTHLRTALFWLLIHIGIHAAEDRALLTRHEASMASDFAHEAELVSILAEWRITSRQPKQSRSEE